MEESMIQPQYTESHCPQVLKGFLLPGLPHPLLVPTQRPAYQKLRQAFNKVSEEIEQLNPDVIIIYSTYWASILGHQIQALPRPQWTLVDDEWHSLGSIPYEFQTDVEFAHAYNQANLQRGLKSRLTAYEGFPIDTGSVVALKLIDPKNKFKSCVVSSNIYSDRAEQVILGKGVRDALREQNKTAVIIAISSLSNRYTIADPKDCPDKISSKKDEEWNQKFLEFLAQGRLEDVSQLSRQFHREARVSKKVVNYKPFWWLSAVMGETNAYAGEVYEYQPIQGTGNAIVGLTPVASPAPDLEFDEDDVEYYRGDRNVLSSIDEVSDDVESQP
jgi:2-aminophenol/2-amino-5-chlorophenol 1,6-dioxygenase subunit alpha